MRQQKGFLAGVVVALLIVAGGCSYKEEPGEAETTETPMDTGMATTAAPAAPSAQVMLMAANDADFHGTVTFTQEGNAVRVVADLSGVDKPGKHGFHLHEHGTCDAHDAFKSAGGHWNPGNSPHACPPEANRHAGDLGNIEVGADGSAHMETIVEGLTVAGGDRAVSGRALVLHAGEDDCKTQPTGNSGDRYACGVIGGNAATPMTTAAPSTTGGTQ
jgi:Cu-Zn family superoxide dismutase